MGECRCVDEQCDTEQHHEDLSLRGGYANDRIEEAGVYEKTADNLVWNLDEYLGKNEGFPAVSFAGSFSDFVQVTLSDKVRLDLLDNSTEERGHHKKTVENILHPLLRHISIVEGETDEKASRDAKNEFC